MRISFCSGRNNTLPGNALIKEEKEMAVGNRVFLKRNLPDNYLVEEFSKLPAANVADCMGRLCGMNPRSD